MAAGTMNGKSQTRMSVPVLADVEKRIEDNLLPENRANYQRVVEAGTRTGLDKGPDSIIAKLRESKNPVKDCAVGAVNLAVLMRVHSRMSMPVQAMVPASMTLMLHALDMANRLGLVKVDQNVVNTATHIFTEYWVRSQGITPQMITHAAGIVHGITQDPTKMDMLARRTGVVKHPMASEPTDLPPGPNETAPSEESSNAV